MANGRVFGDASGKFTCHKWNGSSLVDYVLTDVTLLSKMKYFSVSELIGDLSDHCKISFALPIMPIMKQKFIKPQTQCQTKYISFKWHASAAQKIKEILLQNENNAIIRKMTFNEIANVDYQVELLNKLLFKTAERCLRKRTKRKKACINHGLI